MLTSSLLSGRPYPWSRAKPVSRSPTTTSLPWSTGSLPPHPEVPDALATLKGSGLTVVALVNSLASVGEQQLKHSGIRDAFGAVLTDRNPASPVRTSQQSLSRSWHRTPTDLSTIAANARVEI